MRLTRYLVVAALALGGCGGGSDSDSGRLDLERDLARTVEEQTGTRDVRVECLDGADVCTVTAPGGVKGKVTVEGKVVQP